MKLGKYILYKDFSGGATGIKLENPIDSNQDAKIRAITTCFEGILRSRNLKTVTPFSFLRGLIMFSSTRSKLAVNLNGMC